MNDKANNNNGNTSGEQKDQQPLFTKGMSLDKFKEKFEKKLDTAKAKAFEQKFEGKFKELDAANGIVRNIEKELEKMYVEFSEGL